MGWLRPGHLIVLAVLAVVIAGGAITKGFGLFGAKVDEPQRLAACFDHHHVNVGSVTSIVGDPTTLLSSLGGHPDTHALRAELRHARVEGNQARAVLTCVRRITR
jgi:hypothetical protein